VTPARQVARTLEVRGVRLSLTSDGRLHTTARGSCNKPGRWGDGRPAPLCNCARPITKEGINPESKLGRMLLERDYPLPTRFPPPTYPPGWSGTAVSGDPSEYAERIGWPWEPQLRLAFWSSDHLECPECGYRFNEAYEVDGAAHDRLSRAELEAYREKGRAVNAARAEEQRNNREGFAASVVYDGRAMARAWSVGKTGATKESGQRWAATVEARNRNSLKVPCVSRIWVCRSPMSNSSVSGSSSIGPVYRRCLSVMLTRLRGESR
jgi:hypothetical protein